MKKRLFTLFLTLFLIPVLAGCIRVDTTMKVNANKTVDVQMLFAFNTEMIPTSGDENPAGPSQEEIDKLKAEGYVYEAYSQDGFTGYTLSKKGIDLNAIGSEETGMEAVMEDISFKVDGDHVTVEVAPFSDDTFEENGEIFGQLKSYGGYMNFNLEIPAKAAKHNATSVSRGGKLLTWDLTAMKAGDKIYAEFDLNGGGLPWLLPVIGGVLAVAVVAAIVMVARKKKGKTVPETLETVCETVREKVEDAEETVREKAEDVKEAVQEKAETVREKVEDAEETVQEKVETVREKVEDVKETVREKVEDAEETVREKVEDAKETIEEKGEND